MAKTAAIAPSNLRRIAVALEYPLTQQGGTEVLVKALIQGLSRYFEIVLVSGDETRDQLPKGISELISAHLTWNIRAPDAASALGLATALRQQQVLFVHFHFGGTFTWQSNRFWRCPIRHLAGDGIACLATNHLAMQWLNCGVRPDRPQWQKHLYQLFAIFSRSLVFRHLQFEICVSKHDEARLKRMFPHFRHKIIQRYHSLLPAEAPPPDLVKRDPVILCVGTIGGRKAQLNLAEAFGRIAQRHSRWELHFVGRLEDPADAHRIKESAARYGLQNRIHLLGRLADEETTAMMKRASIFAMPSLQEGLGLSLQEALFHGCVGLGSRVGGIPELIDHGVNGLLAPPGDVPALSAALDQLLSNPGLLREFRIQSRPSILRKGMTAPAMLSNYLELYNGCLAPKR